MHGNPEVIPHLAPSVDLPRPANTPAIREGRSPAGGLDRRDWLIIAILVAVILLYFRSLIWTDRYIYGELDIRRSIYLFRKVSYELIRSGSPPLWMPYIYCGMPLIGSFLATPFYPSDLIFALTNVPLNMAFNWDLLIHLFAAQVFSYLFFKRLFSRRVPAVFCSMWFWNFFFLNSVVTGDALNIRAMLLVPVVFYFVEASLGENGRAYNFLFGALALCMQILCGGIQFTFYTMIAVSFYAALLLIARKRRGEEVRGPAIGFAVLIFLALAMASIQLLPAWEYSRLSVRATGIPWFKVWAIEPHQLIGYILPTVEGRDTELGYFGLAALVLAAYSLPFWKDWRKYFFLGLGIVATVYSFGGNTLISSYLAGLPLVRDFRGPFRAAILMNLSVFALAGGTIASFRESGSTRGGRRIIGFSIVSFFLLGGFAAIALYSRGFPGWDEGTVLISAFFFGISIFAAGVLALSSRFQRAAALLLILLLTSDVALHLGKRYSPTLVSDLFTRDWSINHLEEERDHDFFRITVANTAHANYFGLFGFESATGHHPFPLARYAAFLPLLQEDKIASLCSVRYGVTYRRDRKGRPVNPPVDNANELTIRRNPVDPLPRAFLVSRFRIKKSSDEALAALQDDFDPAGEVILERNPGPFTFPAEVDPDRQAKVVSRTANRVGIETRCNHDAILVLSDTYYPGWRAKVDGRKAQVLQGDYVFRAVPVPAGEHRVELEFKPKSFLIGLVISLSAVIGWIGYGLFMMSRRFKQSHSNT